MNSSSTADFGTERGQNTQLILNVHVNGKAQHLPARTIWTTLTSQTSIRDTLSSTKQTKQSLRRRSLELQQTVEMIWEHVLSEETRAGIESKCNLTHIFQTAIRGILEGFSYNCETSNFTIVRHSRCVFVAPGPSAELWSSSVTIFLKQSITPLYAVRPERAATCMHVLMTSAGVTGEAAGKTIQQMHYNAKKLYHNACRKISIPSCYARFKKRVKHLHNTDSNLKKVSCNPKVLFLEPEGIMTDAFMFRYCLGFIWNGISVRHYPT